jgi:acyl dehydratase
MTEQVYGDEIDPGDEIGPLMKHPDLESVQRYMNAGRMAGPGGRGGAASRFTSEETARREGFAGPVIPGAMSQSFLSQLLTDWCGPLGWVRSLEVNFRRPTRHGEPLKCLGLITDKEDEGDKTLVKIDVFVEDPRGDRPTQGVAEVLIPARRS